VPDGAGTAHDPGRIATASGKNVDNAVDRHIHKTLLSQPCVDPVGWILSNLIQNNVLSSLAAVATIITVAASAWTYFKGKNNEKMRASQNLYLELSDTLKSLDYKRFPDDFCHLDIKDGSGKKTLYFMRRSLNHDFYDSLISSGKINFLEPSLQQPIQDIFKRIRMHNEFLTTTTRMLDRQDDNSVPRKAYPYYEWMDKNEVRLNKEIPDMMEKLQQHFEINR